MAGECRAAEGLAQLLQPIALYVAAPAGRVPRHALRRRLAVPCGWRRRRLRGRTACLPYDLLDGAIPQRYRGGGYLLSQVQVACTRTSNATVALHMNSILMNSILQIMFINHSHQLCVINQLDTVVSC
jgi:hypothetical protein